MRIVWFLSQFYLDPIHNWIVPVCSAYGGNYFCPLHPEDDDGWALVMMDTTPQQMAAAKLDPRVIVCGKDYNTPPPEVLSTYSTWLDSSATYMFMGQLIARLAETEPAFHHEMNP